LQFRQGTLIVGRMRLRSRNEELLMATIRIRPGEPSDAATIVNFVRQLASYERQPIEQMKLTEAEVLRDGFPPTARFETLIAEMDGEPVGLALFYHDYSTWEARHGIWVEDLFVNENVRRHGIGRRLLSEVARIGIERGCCRLGLSVLTWNPAREFYKRLGFAPMGEAIPLSVSGDALAGLAKFG